MKFGEYTLGEGNPPLIVADISASHQQDLNRGLRLIEAAKVAGADLVKFQAYTPDTVSINVDRPEMYIGEGSPWEGQHLYELYKKAHTPRALLEQFFRHAQTIGIPAFSSASSEEDVDFLERLHNPIYKVASMDIVQTPLIEYMASKNKPLVISTQMASEDEIEDALDAAHAVVPNSGVIVLHCTPYGCALEDADLDGIKRLRRRHYPDVGYSSHVIGRDDAVIATGLGALIIEKHLTLSRRDGGPDDHFATEPKEFAKMVRRIHEAHKAMQKPEKSKNPHKAIRPSLYVVEDIPAGGVLTKDNVRAIAPSNGLPPCELRSVLFKQAKQDIPRGTPLSWSLIS